MQIVLFPVFLGVAESIVGYVYAVVLVLSVSFQSFVLQHNVHYRVIPLVCNIRNQSHMIASVSAGRNQGYQFNLQCGSFPVPDWIGATSDLETFYTVKALVSNCLRNPYKRFTTRANHLREFSQGVSINNG